MYNLIDRKGFRVQLYYPDILINRHVLFLGLDSAFRIEYNNPDDNRADKYKCFALKIFRFGFGIAKWIPPTDK